MSIQLVRYGREAPSEQVIDDLDDDDDDDDLDDLDDLDDDSVNRSS